MGHEYVELRNTQAAIQAYRRAVDIDGRDYRAWYGLGQTYEILKMHNYVSLYFQNNKKNKKTKKNWSCQCFYFFFFF